MKKAMYAMLVLFLLFGSALLGIWAVVAQPFYRQVALGPIPAADTANLETHVRKLSTQFYPRSFPQTLKLAAAYIRKAFQETEGRLTEQEFDVDGARYANIIVSFGPEGGERIIVGAHYDTVADTPGADDNASGVAGLLELARLLGPRQNELPFRVDLVAYALEEPPYFKTTQMGSAVHVMGLEEEHVPVRAMLALEMIGYFTDEANSQEYPLSILSSVYPTTGNFIAVVGSMSDTALVRKVKAAMTGATPLPVYSINAPAIVPGIDFSDHLNFWQAGYPAVMITDTAFYRNKTYHKAGDTADRLDYRKMAQVVEGVYAYLFSR